ncbi:hypothetical protein AWC04_15990 [Mycolicibacterium fallax]|uniref:Uncharacterized protein n=1 Tax=Mycolicibacterium fallax TaxID=1793 RepID=A0A1X1R5M1_MYCFA|nr:hypothetical protein AWC04_15990 [Mycolicibacterium fallax]BBY99111.1 hypothetical protein MFAL_25780 [Mycolicibacterium fallax]
MPTNSSPAGRTVSSRSSSLPAGCGWSAIHTPLAEALPASQPARPAGLSYQVNALRGLLLGTPANLWVDVGVLLVAAVAGITAAAAVIRRLVR